MEGAALSATGARFGAANPVWYCAGTVSDRLDPRADERGGADTFFMLGVDAWFLDASLRLIFKVCSQCSLRELSPRVRTGCGNAEESRHDVCTRPQVPNLRASLDEVRPLLHVARLSRAWELDVNLDLP